MGEASQPPAGRTDVSSRGSVKPKAPQRKAGEDWRANTLERVRRLILDAQPGIVEERKWRDVPVWSHGGILCTGETYKSVVKLTFMKGAALADPAGLFNSSLEGKARRAIDLREGETLNERAFVALIRAAVAHNAAAAKASKRIQPRRRG